MKVGDVMHSGVEWRHPKTSVTMIAKIMRDQDIGVVPIGEDDKLVGIVTDRDIVCRCVSERGDPNKLTARDVMTKGVLYCLHDEEIEDAIHIMENNQIRRLPVIGKDKRMVGMLSLGDVSHSVPHALSGEFLGAVSAHH